MDIIDPYCTQLASTTTTIATEIVVVHTMLNILLRLFVEVLYSGFKRYTN